MYGKAMSGWEQTMGAPPTPAEMARQGAEAAAAGAAQAAATYGAQAMYELQKKDGKSEADAAAVAQKKFVEMREYQLEVERAMRGLVAPPSHAGRNLLILGGIGLGAIFLLRRRKPARLARRR